MPEIQKTLLERLSEFLSPEPSSPAEQRRDLINTLREAQLEGLINADALAMIEGVFQVGEFGNQVPPDSNSTSKVLYLKLLKGTTVQIGAHV